MIDFIQQQKKQSAKPVQKQEAKKSLDFKVQDTNKPKKKSWLRNLLQPVSGNNKFQKRGMRVDLLQDIKANGLISQGLSPKPKKVKKFDKAFKQEKKFGFKFSFAKQASDQLKEKKVLDVNLLPITVTFQSTQKLLAALLLFFIIAAGVVGILYFAVSLYGQQITEEEMALTIEIEFLDNEIKKYNDTVRQSTAWQLKLTAVDSLLRSHVYWSQFFSALEKVTLPDVYYKGFTASLVNTDINLVSFAKSFTGVVRQLIAYERFPEIFAGFIVSEASLDQGVGVSYNALVNLRHSLFYDDDFINE